MNHFISSISKIIDIEFPKNFYFCILFIAYSLVNHDKSDPHYSRKAGKGV